LIATLSGFFRFLAGVLTAIGLYRVVSYMVERRRCEMGVRMALGADRRRVLALALREASGLLVIGLVIGGLAAAGIVQSTSSLLFGLRPHDPLTIGAAAAALSLVAAFASYVPASRASPLQPPDALRDE
jgi:ABC-type antimicrobial peptide transport system permease subunit